MIINDTNLAILRVLAGAGDPLDVREVADRLPEYGWVPGPRNHPTSATPPVGTVRSNLSALKWNEGLRGQSLAIRSGRNSRATTWAITDIGRRYLEAEDARLARES